MPDAAAVRQSGEMNDRFWHSLIAGLLAAVLLSQWAIQLLQARQASQQLAVMVSIDSALKKQSDATTEMVASLEDLADVIDDIHDHVGDSSQ